KVIAIDDIDVLALSAMAGRQLPFFSLIVPVWLVWTMAGWRGVVGVWPALLVCGGSFFVTKDGQMCPDIRGDRVDGRSEFHSGQFSTRAASTDVPFLDFTGGMMRLLASPAQTRGGYSLIELLVVIAILAILSALMI